MSSPNPPTFRGRDKLYILFLMSYIPTIIFVDCISLYPPNIVPSPLMSLHLWYKDSFNDQLVINQPHWFRFFTLIEVLYQLPLAIWGVWALSTKSRKAPGHLLVWALVGFVTTLTCLFEFYNNELMTGREKGVLIIMYGSYGLIFGSIAGDMFCRIQKILKASANVMKAKKSH